MASVAQQARSSFLVIRLLGAAVLSAGGLTLLATAGAAQPAGAVTRANGLLVPATPAPQAAVNHDIGHPAPTNIAKALSSARLVRMSAVHQTFTVDTTNDTSGPASDCASGNSTACSLRTAIATANADTGHVDAIVIPSGDTITLSLGALDITNSMVIEGAGATVNGGAQSGDYVFDVNATSASVQISGLGITNATDSAVALLNGNLVLDGVDVTDSHAIEGGGVYEDNGQLWIENSTVSDNRATYGGAFYLNGGSAYFSGSTFGGSSAGAANTAEYGAGGYNYEGDLVVNDCSFDYNSGGVTVAQGVGFYAYWVTDVTGSTFDHNTAADGGDGVGLFNEGQLTLTDSSVDDNRSGGANSAEGVGIYSDGYATDFSNVNVDGNVADPTGDAIYGTGVYAEDDKFTWNGGSIDGSSSGDAPSYSDAIDGGAIYTDSYSALIKGVSIADTTNNAGPSAVVSGGAIYTGYYSSVDAVSVSDTSNTGTEVEGGAVYVGDYSTFTSMQISSTKNVGSSTSGGAIWGGVFYDDSYTTLNGITASGTSDSVNLANASTPSASAAYLYGGDIFNDEESSGNNITFTDTTISATGGSGYETGGGLYNEAYMTLTNANFTGFKIDVDAFVEGGLLANYSEFAGTNVTFGDAQITIPGSTVSTTPSASGSIIDSNNALDLSNGTFAGVTVSLGSGATSDYGIQIRSGYGDQFTNVTVADNSLSGPSNDTKLIYVTNGAQLSLGNSIVTSDDSAGNCGVESSTAAIVSVGHNLDSGKSCGFTAPGDLQDTNPGVGSLADNGGPVETVALRAGSPAVDSGDSHMCPGTDARGVPRVDGCDLGAFQYSAQGYWEIGSDGGVFTFGQAGFHGSMGGRPLVAPVIGLAPAANGDGYWEAASDGGVFSFGDAEFYGSMGGVRLNAPVVGIAATTDGAGYWEVASDGGVFAFGDAGFHGSMGGKHLNSPIVGIVPTADGGGYWEVASDGGVFSFGDAGFWGSMGAKHLNAPVVGMASTPDGGGYWLVGSDGGIFCFGDAVFNNSMGGKHLNAPVVGIASTPDGGGYWLYASDGGVFSFGDAEFLGSMGGRVLSEPIVTGAGYDQVSGTVS